MSCDYNKKRTLAHQHRFEFPKILPAHGQTVPLRILKASWKSLKFPLFCMYGMEILITNQQLFFCLCEVIQAPSLLCFKTGWIMLRSLDFINIDNAFSDPSCTSKHQMNQNLEHRTTQSEFKASEMALPLSLDKPEI